MLEEGSIPVAERGVLVSPSGARSIWLRRDLANFKTRLKALQVKVAEDGILTEAQVRALEKKKPSNSHGLNLIRRVSDTPERRSRP